jgi:amine acid ABC transporter, permease protein, 3-TM region, His/Glu/Gln/Arg/opine family
MNKRKFRIICMSFLIVLYTLLGSMSLQSSIVIVAEEKSQEVETEGVFRVGMEAGYAPFNWTQSGSANGGVQINGDSEYAGGYDVAIAQLIADGLGKKLVIEKIEWDGLAPALTSGKIDAIIAGMSPTEERKKTIDFTDIYYKSDLVMVVQREGNYANATSIQEFAGAKVTGQLNTFHYSVIEQIQGVQAEPAMDNFSVMRVALEAGIIDGYVTERPEAVSTASVSPKLVMVEFNDGFVTSPEDTQIAVGVEKGSPLTAQINEILANISEEERTAIMDKAILIQPSASESEEVTESWLVRIIKENWKMLLRGAGTTLYISLIGTIIGSAMGLCVGIVRTIPVGEKKAKKFFLKIINVILNIYVEVFRGTPMIVQAMVIYYGSAMVLNFNMNRVVAAIFIVSINTGAYMSEIVRGGIVSIDKGQFEAASAIGMNHMQTMKNVVLPQVIRNILPATGNEFVINIKDTSVLNVISVTELFFQAKSVAGSNLRYYEAFFVASVLYLIMTITVTRILRYIEKRMDGPKNYIVLGNQMQVSKAEDIQKKK